MRSERLLMEQLDYNFLFRWLVGLSIDPGNPSVDFYWEGRSNQTHQSTTDAEARLARKGLGKEAKLSFAGHVLMNNREGIAVGGCVNTGDGKRRTRSGTQAGRADPRMGERVTPGANKGHGRKEFIQELREHQE